MPYDRKPTATETVVSCLGVLLIVATLCIWIIVIMELIRR